MPERRAETRALADRRQDRRGTTGGTSQILGPKSIFVTGLVKFVTAGARLVLPDLLG